MILGLFLNSCTGITIERDKDGTKSFRATKALKTDKTYDVGAFNKIKINASLKVYLTQDSTFSLKGQGKKHEFDNLTISNENGTLTIDSKKDLTFFGDNDLPDMYISLPNLEKLEISGASSIIGQNKFIQNAPLSIEISGASEIDMEVDVPSCFVGTSGAGDVMLKGKSQKLEVRSNGATDLKGNDLVADSVTVAISGAGDISVHAVRTLDITASGAGSIKYKGTPVVNKSVTGLVSIEQAE